MVTVYVISGVIQVGRRTFTIEDKIRADRDPDAIAGYRAKHPNAKSVQIQKILQFRG